MMNVLERFPQIGGINDYIELPPGEKVLYNQYTWYAIEKDEKTPVLKISR